jgi:hypothetical protein
MDTNFVLHVVSYPSDHGISFVDMHRGAWKLTIHYRNGYRDAVSSDVFHTHLHKGNSNKIKISKKKLLIN